ncbi:MAG TPA: NAD(P)-dependent oxidoreductase [Solirubrobacteraceae bacterium]|jgi:3-hydroxyisobutyrate dehydrogenase-like beta-hydroxyacid dehydrogenase|nr:NAD(P)-dependent oxidoreductase [Solirubrobacteraceae bacterium]
MAPAPAVGFLGLGAMGGRMVARLLASGRRVYVYDPSEAAVAAAIALGAEPCASAVEVANRAETVLLSLPTPEIVREAACGPEGLIGGTAIGTCVDLSTTGPAVAEAVAEQLGRVGVAFVDAPVSGGVTGAQAGSLTVMAAGEAVALEHVRALLDELGGKVFHVGASPGMGQLAKVINNLLSATALVASAEAVALGVKRGLDAEVLLGVLNASSGRNSATAQKLPEAVLPRSFDFGFALELMNKDVQICLDQARAASLELPVGKAVADAWTRAQSASAPGADCTEIVRQVEQRTGTIISS